MPAFPNSPAACGRERALRYLRRRAFSLLGRWCVLVWCLLLFTQSGIPGIRSTGAFTLHTSRVLVYIYLLFPFVRCPTYGISLIHCSRSGRKCAQERLAHLYARLQYCIARSSMQYQVYPRMHRSTHSRGEYNRSATIAARGRAKKTRAGLRRTAI